MPLSEEVRRHLNMRGIHLPDVIPTAHVPKTVPGITIQHDHTAVVRAIRGQLVSARKARTSMAHLFKKPEPGTKRELPSFMKKK